PLALVEFRLELGLPVWRFEGSGFTVKKRVLMPNRQNTVHVSYSIMEAPGAVRLELRPFMHVRHYESPLTETGARAYEIITVNRRFEIVSGGDLPNLRMLFYGGQSQLTLDALHLSNRYTEEQSRGYEHEGTLWSPGFFHVEWGNGTQAEATIVASTESWETVEALNPASALQSE